MRRSLLLGGLLLAGCGKEIELKPTASMHPIAKPATAPSAPTVAQRLQPGPEAEPARTDEPLTRSKPRGDDRFDLPPPG